MKKIFQNKIYNTITLNCPLNGSFSLKDLTCRSTVNGLSTTVSSSFALMTTMKKKTQNNAKTILFIWKSILDSFTLRDNRELNLRDEIDSTFEVK